MEILGYLAYMTWCYLGLKALDPERPGRVRLALWLCVLRLGLGVGVGVFIFLAALSMNNATRNAPLTYVYVPVRIAEWAFMHLFVSRRTVWPTSVGWVLGGVVASCLADIPL